ncbi:MAG: hypothetical protein IH848_04095 [Acidobacteria bacterium]|nr:hypothetical protein [Acidobacteriota bacterium]
MKKRKKRKAPKSLVNTKVEHTGLFRRKTVSAQLMKGGVWSKKAQRQYDDAIAEFPDDIYDIIESYDRNAEEGLATYGPPYGREIKSSGLGKASELPQPVVDALMTRAMIQLLRKALEEEDAAKAAWQTWRLVGSTITSALRPAEPLVVRGRTANETSRRGRQKAADLAAVKHEQWRHVARKIWDWSSTLSARSVAGIVKSRIDSKSSSETIRKRIADLRP